MNLREADPWGRLPWASTPGEAGLLPLRGRAPLWDGPAPRGCCAYDGSTATPRGSRRSPCARTRVGDRGAQPPRPLSTTHRAPGTTAARTSNPMSSARGAAQTTCSRQRLPRQLWPPRPRGNARTGRSNAHVSSTTRCSGTPGPRRRTAPRPPRRTGRRRPIGGLRTCSRTRPGRPYRAGTSARAPRVRRGCPLSLPPSGFLGHELQTHGPETPKSEGRGVMKVILF